jgi:hypothetical protein
MVPRHVYDRRRGTLAAYPLRCIAGCDLVLQRPRNLSLVLLPLLQSLRALPRHTSTRHGVGTSVHRRPGLKHHATDGNGTTRVTIPQARERNVRTPPMIPTHHDPTSDMWRSVFSLANVAPST